MRSLPRDPARSVLLALALAACGGSSAPRARAGVDRPEAPPHGAPFVTTLDRDHPLVGRIYAVAQERPLTPRALLLEVRGARFLLLGESHDNPDHHRLQAAVLQGLVDLGARPAVVMEQFDLPQRPDPDEDLAPALRDPAALAQAGAWAARRWPGFEHYRPILQVALANGLILRAGNASRGTLEALLSLDPEAFQTTSSGLCADRAMTAAQLETLRQEIAAAHCGALPAAMLPRFARMQTLRDALMADAMRRADDAATARGRGRPPGGAVLIAGAGHARNDYGVPAYAACRGARSVRSIAFLEVTRDERHLRDYAARFHAATVPFDYVWFTPRASDGDPCAAMRPR